MNETKGERTNRRSPLAVYWGWLHVCRDVLPGGVSPIRFRKTPFDE